MVPTHSLATVSCTVSRRANWSCVWGLWNSQAKKGTGVSPGIQWLRCALQWRHNERDGVSNHQSLDCLLKRLFRRRSKKTSELRVTGLCEGNSPVNSPHKGPVTWKCFHLMTSSWDAESPTLCQQVGGHLASNTTMEYCTWFEEKFEWQSRTVSHYQEWSDIMDSLCRDQESLTNTHPWDTQKHRLLARTLQIMHTVYCTPRERPSRLYPSWETTSLSIPLWEVILPLASFQIRKL